MFPFFQVYKTQLERVSEGWNSKIGDFERVNVSLQVEMAQLQRENEDLKGMVRLRDFVGGTFRGFFSRIHGMAKDYD